MKTLVCFDFPFAGPFGDEMARALQELAQSITQEPGFLWKIWTENVTSREAGGVYLFTDEASAQAYVAKHSQRLAEFGIRGINAKIFAINEALTGITKGPL